MVPGAAIKCSVLREQRLLSEQWPHVARRLVETKISSGPERSKECDSGDIEGGRH